MVGVDRAVFSARSYFLVGISLSVSFILSDPAAFSSGLLNSIPCTKQFIGPFPIKALFDCCIKVAPNIILARTKTWE